MYANLKVTWTTPVGPATAIAWDVTPGKSPGELVIHLDGSEDSGQPEPAGAIQIPAADLVSIRADF